MTDGQGDNLDNNAERSSRRGGAWAALILAAIAAGGFGYWTANKVPDAPMPSVPVAEQKPAEPVAAKAPEPEQQAAATTPAEPAKTETPAQATVEVSTSEPAAAPVVESKPAEAPKVTTAEPVQEAAAASQPSVQSTPETKPAEPAPVTAAAAPAEFPAERPSFDTVRIEPAGDAVIAGRAAPGADVHVMLNGVQIGNVVASSDGSFAFVTDKPLPAGTGTLTLEVIEGGKAVVSEASVAVAVKDQAKGEALVAVLKPGKAPEIVQAPSTSGSQSPADTVALDSVDYDADGNIVFAGRGEKGSKVRVYVDNVLTGEVAVGDDGKWSYSGGQAVAAGKHMLRADELKADGTVASRVELPFLREEKEKLAAAGDAAAPATEEAAGTDVASADPQRMVIQPGNNLWKLSRKMYGRGMRYTIIWEANKDQIRNPDLIYPGQVFVMPKAE